MEQSATTGGCHANPMQTISYRLANVVALVENCRGLGARHLSPNETAWWDGCAPSHSGLAKTYGGAPAISSPCIVSSRRSATAR